MLKTLHYICTHSTSQHSECKKLGGNDPSGCHHPLGFCCSAQHCRLPQLSRLSSLSQMGIFWMDEVIEAVMGHSLQSMLQWAIELATQLLEGLRGQKIKLIQFRRVSVVEFYDPTLGIGKVFGQESTVVKWNYQILGLHQVTVCQKLGVILVIKWFKNSTLLGLLTLCVS